MQLTQLIHTVHLHYRDLNTYILYFYDLPPIPLKAEPVSALEDLIQRSLVQSLLGLKTFSSIPG